MNGADKIRKAYVDWGLMTEGEANAANIYKGYDQSTGATGWHVVPFGLNPRYIGRTVADALDMIAEQGIYRQDRNAGTTGGHNAGR